VVLNIMDTSSLLRFLNPRYGPVTSIISAPYPSFWSRVLWHSSATLHPDLKLSPGARVLESCGSGWSGDKQESQCKAVTEAVERWAFSYYQKFPDKAGLALDNTSTGFAALPGTFDQAQLYVNAYCEALERWTLNSIWDNSSIPLNSVALKRGPLIEMFSKFKGRLHCFKTIFDVSDLDFFAKKEAAFFFCIFETSTGGAIPGSACGIDEEKTLQRALVEALIHTRVLNRLKEYPPDSLKDILERRILFFGNDPAGFAKVKERIDSGASNPPPAKPPMVFSKQLPGPWNPEILVHRVILKDSLPFSSGGAERFVI